MSEIRGILFSKVKGKGTRSEGPEYYLKPLDDYKRKDLNIILNH